MKHSNRWAALVLGAAVATSCHAGIYTDDMSRCLVKGTSAQDKTVLVQWIFVVASLHPDVKSMFEVSEERRNEANRAVGKLMERLVTETCRTQVIDAARYEGPKAVEASFGFLGQVAMEGLMSDKSVTAGFREIARYVDPSKFKDLLPPAR